MNERQVQELALLRTRFPVIEVIEVIEDGAWVRIGDYPIPGGLWNMTSAPVAFQIPPSVAHEPYAFYVPKGLALADGSVIQNHTDGTTPFEGEWAKFSWHVTWEPAAELVSGTTMLAFVTSFANRLRQGA